MTVLDTNRQRAAKFVWTSAILLFALAGTIQAGETRNKVFAARAEAEYQRTQKEFQSGTNTAAAWQFARACFDFADFSTNETQRAALANQGIAACRTLVARETNSAPGHYYLALNFGQLARAEAPALAAYHLVRDIEREFKIAAQLDPAIDYAGPERGLGQLYRDAPGWPISIGSKRKARSFLEQSVKLAPDFPENRLDLAETYLQWHEPDHAKTELETLDALWLDAQKKFTGESWDQSWDDWTTRRAAARKKFEELSKPSKNGR